MTAEAIGSREHQVLGLIARGRSNREIGDALGISEHTAKTYVSRLMAKLGARDRAHAVALGYQAGLLTVDPVQFVQDNLNDARADLDLIREVI